MHWRFYQIIVVLYWARNALIIVLWKLCFCLSNKPSLTLINCLLHPTFTCSVPLTDKLTKHGLVKRIKSFYGMLDINKLELFTDPSAHLKRIRFIQSSTFHSLIFTSFVYSQLITSDVSFIATELLLPSARDSNHRPRCEIFSQSLSAICISLHAKTGTNA